VDGCDVLNAAFDSRFDATSILITLYLRRIQVIGMHLLRPVPLDPVSPSRAFTFQFRGSGCLTYPRGSTRAPSRIVRACMRCSRRPRRPATPRSIPVDTRLACSVCRPRGLRHGGPACRLSRFHLQSAVSRTAQGSPRCPERLALHSTRCSVSCLAHSAAPCKSGSFPCQHQ
jgi:hypothetical protein